jgi:pSer/pThr/pTyr-binding forkhead associated (FHA) protein
MNYKFVLFDIASGTDRLEWILPLPVVVGRCPTADITIGDASISRRHCQFLLDPHDSLMVRDLGSKNGVFVDERRVDKAVVRPGSQVRIGVITLRPELTDEEADLVEEQQVEEVFDLGETQAMQAYDLDAQRESPSE